MPIWLDVHPHSGVPIYIQIVEQIKRALEVGVLRPGDSLPTVRQLASELTVAPNTIVKAYGELEGLGLIESRAGAGTRVSAGLDGALRLQASERVRERLRQLVGDAVALKIDERALREWFESEVRRGYGEPAGEADLGDGRKGAVKW